MSDDALDKPASRTSGIRGGSHPLMIILVLISAISFFGSSTIERVGPPGDAAAGAPLPEEDRQPQAEQAIEKDLSVVPRLIGQIEDALARNDSDGLAAAQTALANLKRIDPGNRRISEFTAQISARKLPEAPLLQGSQAGERKTIELSPGISMEFVWIPAGSFMMGSPPSEKKRGDDEGPIHRVQISAGFWMGRFEVTQAVWESVTGNNPSQFKGSERPVETVSWIETQSFLNRLNNRFSGRPFRLPTEAEWEYACRAGTGSPFSTGDCITTDQANFDGGRPYSVCYMGLDRQSTVDVGTFSANAWGLFDMHGNVCEWCWDCYDDCFYEKSPASDPLRLECDGSGRVHRGGGWNSGGGSCRSAYRNGNNPDKREGYLGFRLVRSPR